jgi:uncharacterized membrane protein YhaH (DUF805 family)
MNTLKDFFDLKKDKIGRLEFLAWYMTLFIIGFLYLLVYSHFKLADPNNIPTPVTTAGLIILPACACWALVMAVKRLRDISWPPWLIVLFFIPYINFIFPFVLCIWKGTGSTK